jgi:hypothetical protein
MNGPITAKGALRRPLSFQEEIRDYWLTGILIIFFWMA